MEKYNLIAGCFMLVSSLGLLAFLCRPNKEEAE